MTTCGSIPAQGQPRSPRRDSRRLRRSEPANVNLRPGKSPTTSSALKGLCIVLSNIALMWCLCTAPSGQNPFFTPYPGRRCAMPWAGMLSRFQRSSVQVFSEMPLGLRHSSCLAFDHPTLSPKCKELSVPTLSGLISEGGYTVF